MSGEGHRSQPRWYEVTVVGPVGAVLRQALAPCLAEPVQAQTIVRARAREDLDIVDVAQDLLAHGSTVSAIAVLDDPAPRRLR